MDFQYELTALNTLALGAITLGLLAAAVWHVLGWAAALLTKHVRIWR